MAIPENVLKTKLSLRGDTVDLLTKTNSDGSIQNGQLTRVGFEQAVELGRYLAKTYQIDNVDDIYCRSTATARTVETMRGIATGICENQTVTIDVDDKLDEFLDIMRSDRNVELKEFI